MATYTKRSYITPPDSHTWFTFGSSLLQVVFLFTSGLFWTQLLFLDCSEEVPFCPLALLWASPAFQIDDCSVWVTEWSLVEANLLNSEWRLYLAASYFVGVCWGSSSLVWFFLAVLVHAGDWTHGIIFFKHKNLYGRHCRWHDIWQPVVWTQLLSPAMILSMWDQLKTQADPLPLYKFEVHNESG